LETWAQDPSGKPIFWLNGMAGTGKSTISRTFAQSLAEKGQLGASFFFKRGEGDRGNASRFFTTIVSQLVLKVPALRRHVSKAIEADPAISGRAISEQFQKLVLEPLSAIQNAKTPILRLIIVVDALDECDRERDMETILRLLPSTQTMAAISLPIFVTSRPELPIRLGFRAMSEDVHQDLVLHEMPPSTIEHDISVYLKHELEEVRNDRLLPLDWPSESDIQALVDMAVPLFIFAATVCRFIRDRRWNPRQQLDTVISYQTASQASKLDRTYLPILDHLLVDLNTPEKATLIREFQEIIGSIIILAEPLPATYLAALLDIPESVVECRIDPLHSVLSIPVNKNSPIRLLHLSFREFLVDPLKEGNNPFWITETESHAASLIKCLEMMSRPHGLKSNICKLNFPGKLRADIDNPIILGCLSTDLQYACRYWVYHLEQSKTQIDDGGHVDSFLQQYFRNWLEALSLLGKMSQSIAMITTLERIVRVSASLL
jgi:hypothetical protein